MFFFQAFAARIVFSMFMNLLLSPSSMLNLPIVLGALYWLSNGA